MKSRKKRIKCKIWKDIPEYKGLYQVSNLGRIKSIPHLIKANKDGGTRFTEEHIKNTSVGWHGYVRVSLCKNGKQKTHSVHRLVAMAFIENPNELPAVNHIDGRAAAEIGRNAFGFEIDRNFYQRAKNEMLVFERDNQISFEDIPGVMP